MAEVVLKAEKRDGAGKKVAKQLRNNGKIPAVVYGKGDETIPIAIDAKYLSTLLQEMHGETSLLTLQLGQEKRTDRKVVFKEFQRDPVSGEVLHLDLHHISLTENIHLEVPVILKGIPIGVRSKGGIVQHALHKVEVECLPTNIPEHFELNIEDLDVGDSYHVEKIEVDNVRILTDPQRTVVTVVPPTIIKEEVPAEEVEVEEEGAEPELIDKKEEKEEETEKDAK